MRTPKASASGSSAAEGCRPCVANAVQLQQVLLNLTRNAVDAMRGTLGKDRGIVVVDGAHASSGGVRISVADHGHGVSRQLGDNIFHPFVTTKREGLGVGLAISRTIVQSYGGSLTYRDNPAGGAVFEIELPPPEESTVSPSKNDPARARPEVRSSISSTTTTQSAIRSGLLLRSIGLDCELHASALDFLERLRSRAARVSRRGHSNAGLERPRAPAAAERAGRRRAGDLHHRSRRRADGGQRDEVGRCGLHSEAVP